MKDSKNYKWKTENKLEMMRNGYKLPNLGSNKIMINIMMRRTTMNKMLKLIGKKMIMLKRRIMMSMRMKMTNPTKNLRPTQLTTRLSRFLK